MKKLVVSSLVSLFVLSCSVPVHDNSSPFTFHPSPDFTDLEKEYKSFSTKALSDAYVSRMFNRFLTASPNPTQVIRQLEFARYLKDIKSDPGYFNSLKTFVGGDSSKFNLINTTNGVTEKKLAESATFGTFVDSLNPVQVPIVPAGFKLLEKGSFTLGNSEFPEAHSVTFTKDLFMGEYEVTQGEWSSVYNAGTTTSDLRTRMGSEYPSYYTTAGDRANHPVENVTWLQVIAYCNAKSLAVVPPLPVAYDALTGAFLKADGSPATSTTEVVGYRLLTEAEWEYAAKGGNKTSFCAPGTCTYSGSNNADLVAIYGGASNTATVGSKSPNELGLYDMSGNVWEWVQDINVNYSSAAAINPYISSGNSRRVIRGGSLYYDVSYARSAFRGSADPLAGSRRVGFRLCRSVN